MLNKGYFSKIYPMNNKGEAGDALRTFCREFGVPEHLTFDGSKEQTGKKTEFMSQIRKNYINYRIGRCKNLKHSMIKSTIRKSHIKQLLK